MDPLMIECPVCHAKPKQQCTATRWINLTGVCHTLRQQRANQIADVLANEFMDEIDQWKGTP